MRTEIWYKGASQAGRYADTDYAGPLDRFEEYARRLAKDGYSAEEFGRFVLEVFEKKRPRIRYAIVRGRFANFTPRGSFPTACSTGSSRGT